MKRSNNKTVSRFQSYLIVGHPNSRRNLTESLVKNLGGNLNKVSPDIFKISPQKSVVSIDQIRELKKHVFQKPVALAFKFIIIEEAEKATVEAQNALLKILEEPPESVIIILETKDKSQLLPTILSRTVVKIASQNKTITEENLNLLEEKDVSKLLEKIPEIENPTSWLDNQILILHKTLITNIRENLSNSQSVQIRASIEKCVQTKQMIEANVNPRFALANLIFCLKLQA